MQDPASRIAAQRAAWIAAINEGSADRFVSVLAEDAVWLPARHPAVDGRERIREWLEKPFASFDYLYEVADIELRLAGNRAVERARFTTDATTRSGDAMPAHTGRYIVIWREERDGQWLIECYVDLSADFEREDSR